MGERSKLRLKKQESLTDVKLIDLVFKSKLSIKAFPLIFSYNLLENSSIDLQVLFSVSKRKFKKAVDRNRIKRLTRECFRLRKPQFQAALKGRQIYGAFIYTNKEITDFQSVDKAMAKIISKLDENPRD
jgi:ribonuclease P protein component